MELYGTENVFLEELLALRSDINPLETIQQFPLATNELYNNGCSNNFDNGFAEGNTINIPPPSSSSSSFQDYYSLPFGEFYTPFGVELTDSSNNKLVEDHHNYSLSSMVEDEDHQGLGSNGFQNMDMEIPVCKVEPILSSAEVVPSFNIGISPECKNKVKKLNGQPSKNLMAERRRRKRLNDRLSMLRSVVPKISKMDRTSILGDTIEYMKELLERINNLQDEMDLQGSDQLSLMSIFNNIVKPTEVSLRNSPKFDVERREIDTRIEICCGGKPGMLLSSVTTLEALGLEIQQCVISCFNDFAMQASCSEDVEQRGSISSEDIKQALFRNAGYGGRCL